ncbi:MAG: sensor histidine kinase [Chloroflexi bacterium]|nr:sensor histidine kinase [Chloroflexota bacterium]
MSKEDVARWTSWSLAGLSVAMAVAGFVVSVLAVLATRDPLGLYTHELTLPLIVIIFSVLGPLVVARHPRHPIGWIMTLTAFSAGVVGLNVGLRAYGEHVLGPDRAPWLVLVKWLDWWVWIPSNVLPITFLILLFPDGHLLSPRWRPVAWAAGFGMAGMMLGSALNPVSRMDTENPLGRNPFAIPGAGPVTDALLNVGGVLLLIAFIGSIAALVLRFRSSSGVQRQQLKWVAYATVLLFASVLLSYVLYVTLPQESPVFQISVLLMSLGLLGIPLAACVAILRYRLFDIDVVINRTLVYSVLTFSTMAVYIFIVGYLGGLFQASEKSILAFLATGLVAVTFNPLREWLQRGVNRVMYGERDDPYAVLSRLGQRLEATLAPEAVLPTIVETVAQALKLPCAAIALKEGEGFKIVAASPPSPPTPLPLGEGRRGEGQGVGGEVLPLVYQGEIVGQLIFSPRAPGEAFTAVERRLLEDIAHQAGVAVHAVRLTVDLQRSRERIVTAREEERRHIRRELHDGLGPSLAGLTLKMDAARNLLTHNPRAADDLLADLKSQTQSSIDDIRRLAYSLRPPALDELGLLSAIQEFCAGQERIGLLVTVESPENIPPLSAAVEAATYRIVCEALTNAARHARAGHCTVQIRVNKNLEVEICDDGQGVPEKFKAGVGLASMRERAAELGGQCRVESRPEGGTRVLAVIPIGRVN